MDTPVKNKHSDPDHPQKYRLFSGLFFNRTKNSFCAKVADKQEGLIFIPEVTGMKPIMPPEEYPELKALGVRESFVTASDGAKIALWEKQGVPGKPHFLLFHGNTGDWVDSGPKSHRKFPNYDRHATLQFMEKIGQTGAGFTAVHMRGYGRSRTSLDPADEKFKPGEEAFSRDLDAVITHMTRVRRIPHDQVVVAGMSMGTAVATMAAEQMTQRSQPPALLTLCNPFTRMDDLASDVVRMKYHVKVLRDEVAEYLRHPFNTEERVKNLSPATAIYIFTSGADSKIDPKYSAQLADSARKSGHKVFHQEVPGIEHYEVPPGIVIPTMMKNYDESRALQMQREWARRVMVPPATSDLLPGRR